MLNKRKIVIFGGTGTLGSGLAKEILFRWPEARVLIFSRDENKQYHMHLEDKRYYFAIGDVRDRIAVGRAVKDAGYVINCAAMKHVPICESNPYQAVMTNIIGTKNICDAIIENDAPRFTEPHFIHISTDKAVNPVSHYGATKLCAERTVISSLGFSRYAIVRLGNILGSRGSFLPLLMSQKRQGVVTLTDEMMSRYFIRQEEAVDFVLRIMLDNQIFGQVFIPHMLNVKIKDLIKVCAPEAKIKIIGRRPGEKIHEELFFDDEKPRADLFPWGFVIRHEEVESPFELPCNQTMDSIESIRKMLEAD